MTHEFEIDGVVYTCYWKENNEIVFYVNTLKSKRSVYKISPLDHAFGDTTPELVFLTTNTGHALRVKTFVMKFIHNAIQHYKPYFFTYSALEPERIPVYKKIAERIAKKYNYTFSYNEKNDSFIFLKNTQFFNGKMGFNFDEKIAKNT